MEFQTSGLALIETTHLFSLSTQTHFASLRHCFQGQPSKLRMQFNEGMKTIDEYVAMHFLLRTPRTLKPSSSHPETRQKSCRYTNTTKTRNSAHMFPPTVLEYAQPTTTHHLLFSIANGAAKKLLDGIA